MTNIGNFFNLRNSHVRENVQGMPKEGKKIQGPANTLVKTKQKIESLSPFTHHFLKLKQNPTATVQRMKAVFSLIYSSD